MQNLEDKTGYEMPQIAISSADRYLYHGLSMKGTFRLGDRLIVEKVSLADVQPGDVLVYGGVAKNNEPPNNIVHRVIAVTAAGVIMQGDSNPRADITLVAERNILGRVTHVESNGRLRPVSGGLRGALRGRFLHAKYGLARSLVRWAWRLLAPLLRKPYRWLRRSGLVRQIWHPTVSQIRFQTEEGLLVKYVVDHRTVARWWPQTHRFQCRKPYDLIIPVPDHDTR